MDKSTNLLFGYAGHQQLPAAIVRADNCSLFDADGKRYLDLESGVWCTCIGHSHPRILRVMGEQAANLGHTGFAYSSPVVAESAQAMLDLHGFDGGRCVFLCSGSEAVEFGVRAMQAVMPRPKLITMADSYFGAYGSASARGEDAWIDFDWTHCIDCDRSHDCDRQCPRWAGIPFDAIGGFLFEPGSSSGLVRFPPKKLIRRMVDEVHAGGGMVMVNEVTTGMGRTGQWFGYQHYGIVPDVVAMGKGVGNGYPVSVTAFSAQMGAAVAASGFTYAQSHQNDPLGAAIALEVVRTIEADGLIERGRAIGERLLSGLVAIQSRSGRIRAIRARGLMLALELADDDAATATTRVRQSLVRHGFVVAQRPGLNVLRLDPSLTVEVADIDAFLEVFEQVLDHDRPKT